MKRNIFLLLVFITITVPILAQTKDEKDVAAAVEAMRKAMIEGNRSALEALAAPELSYGHSSGVMENKAAFVESLASKKSDFKEIRLSDQTISIVGNTALVRHKLNADTMNDGTPGTVNLGVLLVWQKQKGEWKLLARQAFRF